MTLVGLGVSAGVAFGRICVVDSAPTPTSLRTHDDLDAEVARLEAALSGSSEELRVLSAEVADRVGANEALIFESHALILRDDEWLGPILDEIRAGSAAVTAVDKVTATIADELASIDDDYLRERAADVRDVGRRVTRHLTGAPAFDLAPGDEPIVVVAHELLPSDTASLDTSRVRGIATEIGARTSHAAILARQLGIPAVVGVDGLIDGSRPHSHVIVDGDQGTVVFDPSDSEIRSVSEAASGRVQYPVLHGPPSTLDGTEVAISANVTSPEEVARAVALGADGIGLYRTEFAFMRAPALPDEAAMRREYLAAAVAAEGRPIVFRTLDIGADKPVPALMMEDEDNPFLGVRGVRLSLERPELFSAQLRALAETSAQFPGVRVMVPMVSGLEELDRVRDCLDEVRTSDGPQLGAMIEVPSAALLTTEICAAVDFVSVGTNDLTGYVLAVDRTNRRVEALYQELHPGVVRAMAAISAGAGSQQTPASICGELAGDVRALPLLVGLGYRHLSVAAPLIPAVKAAIATLDLQAAEALAHDCERSSRLSDITQRLDAFAAERNA